MHISWHSFFSFPVVKTHQNKEKLLFKLNTHIMSLRKQRSRNQTAWCHGAIIKRRTHVLFRFISTMSPPVLSLTGEGEQRRQWGGGSLGTCFSLFLKVAHEYSKGFSCRMKKKPCFKRFMGKQHKQCSTHCFATHPGTYTLCQLDLTTISQSLVSNPN